MASEGQWLEEAIQCLNYFYYLWDDDNYYLAKVISSEGESPNRTFRLHFYNYRKSDDMDVKESYLMRPNTALEYNDVNFTTITAQNKERTAFQLGYRRDPNGELLQVVRKSDETALVSSQATEDAPRRKRGRPKGSKRTVLVEAEAPVVDKPVEVAKPDKPKRPTMILPKLSAKRQSEILHAHLRPAQRP